MVIKIIDLKKKMPNYTLQSAIKRGGNATGVSDVQISSSHATKDKFRNGWLEGIGSDSQFQSTFGLPVLPYRTNNDAQQRWAASTGQTADYHSLLPSWRRSYAWNVGVGLDALKSGITQTSVQAGLLPQSGIAAPLVNAGRDAIGTGPITPFQNYQAGNMCQAPVALFGGEAAECTQYEVAAAQNGNRPGVNPRKSMMLRAK